MLDISGLSKDALFKRTYPTPLRLSSTGGKKPTLKEVFLHANLHLYGQGIKVTILVFQEALEPNGTNPMNRLDETTYRVHGRNDHVTMFISHLPLTVFSFSVKLSSLALA